MPDHAALRRVKVLHTLVWAFFGGSVIAVLAGAIRNQLALALTCAGIVAVEVVILAFNRWRCPLTGVAARYTDDRRANFDIYLPEWLARHNKTIFGGLYLAGMLLVVLRWTGAWP